MSGGLWYGIKNIERYEAYNLNVNKKLPETDLLFYLCCSVLRSVLGGIKVYSSFFPTHFLEANMWFTLTIMTHFSILAKSKCIMQTYLSHT